MYGVLHRVLSVDRRSVMPYCGGDTVYALGFIVRSTRCYTRELFVSRGGLHTCVCVCVEETNPEKQLPLFLDNDDSLCMPFH